MGTVKPTKKIDTTRRTRHPFTVEEIHQILPACDDEWRGLVIFALHGQNRRRAGRHVAHETLAMSSHDTHVGMDSLVSAVTSLPGFIRAPLPEE